MHCTQPFWNAAVVGRAPFLSALRRVCEWYTRCPRQPSCSVLLAAPGRFPLRSEHLPESCKGEKSSGLWPLFVLKAGRVVISVDQSLKDTVMGEYCFRLSKKKKINELEEQKMFLISEIL